ncbi:four helix bundle protein [Flavobacterium sp.]|uniref:four helix bundle protein n=1 Tax=Flavobacterium sp. TaxID=239 RepID=UPI003D0DA4C9
MKTYSFEKLNVWQKSRVLVVNIYKITKKFPKEETFGFTSQLRRCALSISSNIAEGTGRHTNKDKARFIEIAFGSSLELLNQLILSYDLEFISEETYITLRKEIDEINIMLDGFYKFRLNEKK